MVGRRVSKIRELELRPRKVNQRKLITDAARKPRPAARGVEGPTMGEAMQTVNVIQITTPDLTGARKDAGFHIRRMGVVGIFILIYDVLSVRLKARGRIGGHQAPRGYNVPKIHPEKGCGVPIVLEWQVIKNLIASHLSRRFRAHIQTLLLNVGIRAPKPLGVPIRRPCLEGP